MSGAWLDEAKLLGADVQGKFLPSWAAKIVADSAYRRDGSRVKVDVPSLVGLAAMEVASSDAKLALAISSDAELQEAAIRLQAHVRNTLEAIQSAEDPEALRAFQEDLAVTLPARKLALISAARSKVSSDGAAALENGLELLARVGIGLARAFVLGPAAPLGRP